MVLDSTSLMLIRLDCVDSVGLIGGSKAWVLFPQRFRNDEIVTVVNVMRQLAHLQQSESEALYNYFIGAQELSTRLEHLLNGTSFYTLAQCSATQWFTRALCTLCGVGALHYCWQLP